MVTNAELFEQAQKLLPGGVSSPVRAYGAVGGTPRFLVRGQGPYVWDVEGNRYVDYVLSWGPMILGHAHEAVVEAVQEAAARGLSFGAPHPDELELARLIQKAYPMAERVRFVNSGTEATMSALRLARGYTGRDLVVKFRGNYHGHADGLLVEAGSGALTFGHPSSSGVPESYARLTLVARYNDPESLKALFKTHGEEIAAVIFEPVVGNSGVIPPKAAFLQALRDLTREYGALLIVDEVMTGFRLAFGGATERYRLEPDLITLGKIMGGGLPSAAYAGPARIMEHLAPLGPVYQAGTLSGNPLAMAAGAATLRLLAEHPEFYQRLETLGQQLETALATALSGAGVPHRINRVGSMLTVFFTESQVESYEEAQTTDTRRFSQFFHGLLRRGIYWPASAYEAAFLSIAHEPALIEATAEAASQAFS